MAYGDFGSVIDTYDYNPGTTPFIDPIHIAGNVWLMCYQVMTDNIQLNTIEILPDGSITTPFLDVWLIRAGAGQVPRIIRVAANIFAIFDKTGRGVPTVTTFECQANGTFVKPIKDDWNWNTYSLCRHAVAKRTATLQTIAYMGTDDDGFLATIEIDSAGIITDPLVDLVEFDTDYACPFDLVDVSPGIYAMVYRGAGTTGVLVTFGVDAWGQISDPYIDKLVFNATYGEAPSICHVGGDVYAIGYLSSGSKGSLCTVNISSSGAIGATVLDDILHLDFACGIANVHQICTGIIAYAIAGEGHDGWIYSFTINPSTGAITPTPIDSLEFDTAYCDEPVIFHIDGDTWAITYKGPSDHGWLTTIGISTPAQGADHSLMMGLGP